MTWFLTFTLTAFLQAQNLVVLGEDASEYSFEKYLLENPHQQNYLQYFDKFQRPQKNFQEELKQAQFHFLQGSLEEAKDIFFSIVKKQHAQDWKEDDRKIIHYSFFRLAQLERSEEEQKKWLQAALHFDDELPLLEDVFPPPLLRTYEVLKKEFIPQVHPLPINSDQFALILRNGRKLKNSSAFVRAHSTTARWTFLSKKWKPVTLVTDSAKLAVFQLKPLAMVSGTCEKPVVDSDFQQHKGLVFFSNQCISSLNSPAPLQSLMPTDNPSQQVRTAGQWQRNPWLWVGVSLVGSFVAYKVWEAQQSKQNNRDLIHPSYHYQSNAQSSAP